MAVRGAARSKRLEIASLRPPLSSSARAQHPRHPRHSVAIAGVFCCLSGCERKAAACRGETPFIAYDTKSRLRVSIELIAKLDDDAKIFNERTIRLAKLRTHESASSRSSSSSRSRASLRHLNRHLLTATQIESAIALRCLIARTARRRLARSHIATAPLDRSLA